MFSVWQKTGDSFCCLFFVLFFAKMEASNMSAILTVISGEAVMVWEE